MSKEFDAIVVGGGLAGLTSVAYLCKYGYRTLLLEKSHKTGGLVNTFTHQGYAFDAGIRAFENSGILLPMLKGLGLKMDLVQNSVAIGIKDRWTQMNSADSLNKYIKMLNDIFPENESDINKIKQEIQKVMGYMDVLYSIDNPLIFMDTKDYEYLWKTLFPWLFRYQINIRKASRLNKPVIEYLKQFTNNQALIDMIVQHFFKETPTFFALSYFGLYLDYLYPKGGTGMLAQTVTDYVKSAGGEILTDTAVVKVDTIKKELYTASGDSYRYKKLVWAADQKSLYSAIGQVHTSAIDNQRVMFEKGQGGDSILALFIGVNLDNDYFVERCGAHAFYTPSIIGLSSMVDWNEVVGDKSKLYEWLEQYFERTTYEISCPALRDPSLAPVGKTGVIVSTLMDYRLVREISNTDNYEQFKAFCTKKIIEVLEASVFPGITKMIELSLCSTPLTIERETANAQGAITGWAFTNEKMPAENRFKSIQNAIKTPITDVYQCGQWTFSPSGLPVSILTGKLTADAILKTLEPQDQ